MKLISKFVSLATHEYEGQAKQTATSESLLSIQAPVRSGKRKHDAANLSSDVVTHGQLIWSKVSSKRADLVLEFLESVVKSGIGLPLSVRSAIDRIVLDSLLQRPTDSLTSELLRRVMSASVSHPGPFQHSILPHSLAISRKDPLSKIADILDLTIHPRFPPILAASSGNRPAMIADDEMPSFAPDEQEQERELSEEVRLPPQKMLQEASPEMSNAATSIISQTHTTNTVDFVINNPPQIDIPSPKSEESSVSDKAIDDDENYDEMPTIDPQSSSDSE